jgi:hypothetical protein
MKSDSKESKRRKRGLRRQSARRRQKRIESKEIKMRQRDARRTLRGAFARFGTVLRFHASSIQR